MIPVTEQIALPDSAVQERFVRAIGARGQNANHEATAVELSLDLDTCTLPADVKGRLIALAGRAVTKDHVLVIVGRAQRSLGANRADAHARLLALLRKAARQPRPRRATRPRRAVRRARVNEKREHAAVKRLRTHPPAEAEDTTVDTTVDGDSAT